MAQGSLRNIALGDQLASVLRDQIVAGKLEAGTHLVEDQLASDYDVSRGPVRDALRILLAEGLVESRRRGYFVRPFTASDVVELYEVREAIEQRACALAIAATPADGWTAAEKHLASMAAAADTRDHDLFAVADLAFHSAFYSLCGNVRLEALWAQFQPTFHALLEVTIAQDNDLHPSYDDHAALLDLARRERAGEFAARLTSHLQGSRARMMGAMRLREREDRILAG